jgi:hypothetical protein
VKLVEGLPGVYLGGTTRNTLIISGQLVGKSRIGGTRVIE